MFERIKEMEAALNAAESAIRDLSSALDKYEEITTQIRKLEKYYDSGEWRIDFEADEAGLIPADLKRGVLSEDALYNLLVEHEELLKRIKEL